MVFEAIGLAWLLIYVALLGALGAALARPRVHRFIERVSGAILVGLGVKVALDRT
jgi:threonine/homoserine/homoserine lactone efflux protein